MSTYQSGKIIEFTTNALGSNTITTFKFRNDLFDVLTGKSLSQERAALYDDLPSVSLPLTSDQTHKVRVCLNSRNLISVIQQIIITRGTTRSVAPTEISLSSEARDVIKTMVQKFTYAFLDFMIEHSRPENVGAPGAYHTQSSFDFAINVCHFYFTQNVCLLTDRDENKKLACVSASLFAMKGCPPRWIMFFLAKYYAIATGCLGLNDVATDGDLPTPYLYDQSSDRLYTTGVLNIKLQYKAEQCAFNIAPSLTREEMSFDLNMD